MPNIPYLVYGTVKFSGTNQVVSEATVTVTDVNLNQSVSATTNTSGAYQVNLADLTGAWSDGDSLTITAIYGYRSKTETSTISGGGQQVNLVLSITTYPVYNISTEHPISFNSLEIMDYDKAFTYNSKGQVTKEVANYGDFTVTKYFKRNSTGRVTYESRVLKK